MDGCTNYLSQFDVPFRGTGIGLPARDPDCGLDDTGWIGPQPSYPITDCLCAEKEKKGHTKVQILLLIPFPPRIAQREHGLYA